MSDWAQTISWRTTGFAIAYLACNAIGGLYPSVAAVCNVLDKMIIAGGFISAADSTRVQSIVRAVDVVAWKNKIDPSTLVPVDGPSSTSPSVP
jgi:hypothetical protein